MDKIFSRLLIIIIIVLLFVGFDFWISKTKKEAPGTNEQYYKIVSLPIPDTLYFAGEEVPLDLFYVREALDRELAVNTYWHSSSLQLLRKSQRWFPMFDSILMKNGVPSDFKYLSVIESGLANVVSSAGAAGFWQFMKSTGKEYNLEVGKEVDERYNIEKSTEAACAYLLNSYENYNNWTLSAAAYNRGSNGISKQLEKQKTNSYYDLYLNEETSRYLYRILAVKLIFENPESYGFYLDKNDYYQPIPTKIVNVNQKVKNWVDFAQVQGISYKLLKYFNPWIRRSYLTNKKKKTYQVRIPLKPYDLTPESLHDKTGDSN